MTAWAGQDLCLRLAGMGLASVWHPFAEFSAKNLALSEKPTAFAGKWDGRLEPFNKNLFVTEAGFSLSMPD